MRSVNGILVAAPHRATKSLKEGSSLPSNTMTMPQEQSRFPVKLDAFHSGHKFSLDAQLPGQLKNKMLGC